MTGWRPATRCIARRATAMALAFFALWLVGPAAAQAPAELPLAQLQLPPGFRIELLARVPNARQMALSGDARVLYVGSRSTGQVHAVSLYERLRARAVQVVASGLEMPVGVAWRDGNLYISAVHRILRLDGIDRRLDNPPKPVVVRDDLPTETHHGWKFIAFGPDGWLYLPVGAPCNICEPDPARFAAIMRMRPDGSALQTYAQGVRNTVGFDWHPQSGALWFTDNGRDLLGDDAPPDELNQAARPGLHFGYPYCHGGTLADPQYGTKRPCSDFTPPVQALGAHVAALGMRFYTGTQFPAAWRGAVFIAEHGSWNRSSKSGYRVSAVTLAGDRATSYQSFITGWLQGERAWGRPADVLVLPDGSLLVSDDLAGAIYRVRYEAPPASR